MNPKSAKEVQAYKVRTIIFLLIILALSVVAIWQFYTVKAREVALDEKVKELEDANNIIALKDTLLMQSELIKKQKLELDTAILLLGILVNEEKDSVVTPEYILANLNQLAENKRKEIAQMEKRRGELINDLFSGSESRRARASQELINDYSNDRKLVRQIVRASEGKVTMNNRNSVYQIIYILEQLSAQTLQKNKELIEELLVEAEEAGLVGPSTQPRLNAIRARLTGE